MIRKWQNFWIGLFSDTAAQISMASLQTSTLTIHSSWWRRTLFKSIQTMLVTSTFTSWLLLCRIVASTSWQMKKGRTKNGRKFWKSQSFMKWFTTSQISECHAELLQLMTLDYSKRPKLWSSGLWYKLMDSTLWVTGSLQWNTSGKICVKILHQFTENLTVLVCIELCLTKLDD